MVSPCLGASVLPKYFVGLFTWLGPFQVTKRMIRDLERTGVKRLVMEGVKVYVRAYHISLYWYIDTVQWIGRRDLISGMMRSVSWLGLREGGAAHWAICPSLCSVHVKARGPGTCPSHSGPGANKSRGNTNLRIDDSDIQSILVLSPILSITMLGQDCTSD